MSTPRRYDRRGFLKLLAGGTTALGLARWTRPAGAAPADDRPNVVLIFTDDQGYQDLGCFGSPTLKTPHLDRLASEGLKLTDFYVAAPICTPSRAALLTGRYPMRVGLPRVLFPQDTTGLPAGETTLAEVLKALGYATACIGKWHLGHLPEFLPRQHGFDSYFGIPYSNDMCHLWPYDEKRGPTFPPLPLVEDETTVATNPDQRELTRQYTERAVRFIETNRDRPFFLYLAHTMPHVPVYAGEAFRGKSAGGRYGDTIEEIDWSTGRIVETLRRLGLDRRTLVIYTSDNGAAVHLGPDGGSALPLRAGKHTTYEGGMRVPCLAWWPGRIPAGTVSAEMVLSMDLMPTIARLAGASLPADRPLDGKDVWPILSGEAGAKTPHEAFFYWHANNLQAVRAGRWKAVFLTAAAGAPESAELFDLAADIGETKNLAEAHPEVVARLRVLAKAHAAELGGTFGRRPGDTGPKLRRLPPPPADGGVTPATTP